MTLLDEVCIPALRSGFAGYPVNPRWNAVKFHAWKQGCQLRADLKQGKMWVRPEDSMLVSGQQSEQSTEEKASPTSQVRERVSPVTVLLHRSSQRGELNLA